MKILQWFIDKLEETCIVILLAFMAIMNFTNVVCRALGHSFSFTEEITIIAFVWVSMLGIAAGYKRNAHLGMSYVVDHFPKKLQTVFALISVACTLLFAGLLVWYGGIMVQGQIARQAATPSLRLPQAVQGLSIPTGGALIAIRALQVGFGHYKNLTRTQNDKGGV